jgi:PAS domain S-box-containing protein
MELLQASTGDLSLYRPASDDLEAAVLCGMGRELTGTVLKRGEGMGGKVLETGAPLAVEDYHTWPGRAPAYEGLPFGPMVGAPLKWGGQILGTIDVARPGGPPFTKAEVRLLSLFASQAAVAIANARLYADIQRELAERQLAEKQVRQRSQQLSTLFDTSLEVASRLDLAQLLPTIVERAALLLQAVGCDMYLYQPGPDTLEHVVAYGRSEEFLGHILHRGEGLAGKVLDSGEPMAVDDYHHWAGRSLLFEHQDVGAVLAVPVKWGERVLGVIDLERIERDPFNAEDIRLLTLFANQAAIALANAQLYEAARRELVERKSAEAQLRESERYYRAVVEDQTELIYRFTADEQVTFVNDAACRFLGKERQQIIGRSMMSDVVPEEQARVRQALASITHEAPVVTMENRVISGNAKVHWFQWTDRGIFDEQGILTGYQAVGRDICERKRAEATREALQAQLQQAQRMEAVGVLAGGVAHEFNNLLTVIEGNVELALSDLDANQPAWETLATVVKTAQRAAALTRQLLAFSRHQVLQPQELDLNALLANFASLVQPALGPGVKLQLDPSPGIRTVLADARAMEQVLMNLALNARDAMPQGGEIRIATAAVTLDEEFCRTRDKIKPGEYVRLTVADTGTGMDAETLRRMWEPFFTTKEVGKGTGLGLAVVYGIIRQLEGLIEVQSEVGQGTRFDVYLPVFTKQ